MPRRKRRITMADQDGQPRGWRINEAEFAALISIMEYEHCSSMSETVRLVLREAATRRGLWPPVKGASNGG